MSVRVSPLTSTRSPQLLVSPASGVGSSTVFEVKALAVGVSSRPGETTEFQFSVGLESGTEHTLNLRASTSNTLRTYLPVGARSISVKILTVFNGASTLHSASNTSVVVTDSVALLPTTTLLSSTEPLLQRLKTASQWDLMSSAAFSALFTLRARRLRRDILQRSRRSLLGAQSAMLKQTLRISSRLNGPACVRVASELYLGLQATQGAVSGEAEIVQFLDVLQLALPACTRGREDLGENLSGVIWQAFYDTISTLSLYYPSAVTKFGGLGAVRALHQLVQSAVPMGSPMRFSRPGLKVRLRCTH